MDTADLTRIWRASARDASGSEFKNFEIVKAARAVVEAHMPLRQEGHVVFGISQICAAKASQLLTNSEKVDELTGASFLEYRAQLLNAEPGSKRMRLNELDLDTRALSTALTDAADNTALTVDQEMRAGEEEIGDRTADFVFEDAAAAGEDAPMDAELDFSDILSQHPTAPAAFEGAETHTESNARSRSALIDDNLKLKRPPKSQLLRAPPTADEDDEMEAETGEEGYIPLPEMVEQIVLPKYVEKHMRRAPASPPPLDFDEVPSDLSEIDQDAYAMAEEEEFADTEEQLKEDAERARRAVEAALSSKGERVSFSDLAMDRNARACTLMEVLQLASKGRVTLEQRGPWSDVTVTRV